MVGQGAHGRPVGDVGAAHQLRFRFGLAEAVVHAAVIDERLKGIGQIGMRQLGGGPVQLRGRGQATAIGGGGGDGARVHERHGGNLPVGGLGAFAVGEVAGGVADGEGPVGRGVARAEAGAAESGFHHRACEHELGDRAVFDQRQTLRLAGGVYGQVEGLIARGFAVKNGGGQGDIFKIAARATGNDALINPHAAIVHFGAQVQVFGGLAELPFGLGFHLGQQLGAVAGHFGHGVDVAGVEGQGDHGHDLAQVHPDKAVVTGRAFKAQLGIVARAPVHGHIIAHFFVRGPDGRKASGFGGHDVHAAAVFHGKTGHAGAHEFHNLVLHKAVFEHGPNDGQGHVLRAHAGAGRAFKPHGDFFGRGHVIGFAQQLLDQLRPAFANGHNAQRAITGVAVRPQNHAAAFGHHFAHILVNDRQMRGHENAAVFARRRKTEEVVILIDGAAHRAQAVVAVGEGVGNGKFLEAAGARGLDDAHIGDVVGGQGVEADAQHVLIGAGVVRLQNARGKAVIARRFNVHAFGAGFFGGADVVSVDDHGIADKFDHGRPSGVCGSLARRGLARLRRGQFEAKGYEHNARTALQPFLEAAVFKNMPHTAQHIGQGHIP